MIPIPNICLVCIFLALSSPDKGCVIQHKYIMLQNNSEMSGAPTTVCFLLVLCVQSRSAGFSWARVRVRRAVVSPCQLERYLLRQDFFCLFSFVYLAWGKEKKESLMSSHCPLTRLVPQSGPGGVGLGTTWSLCPEGGQPDVYNKCNHL